MSRKQKVLKYVTDIDSSLRLQSNVITLLNQVAAAVCEALGFRHSALYLVHEDGKLHMQSTHGVTPEDEKYLHEHPLTNSFTALLIDDNYRISDSYFIPTESSFWANKEFSDYFLAVNEELPASPVSQTSSTWRNTDMIIVPLLSADNTLLGILTPDSPINELRPDVEMMECLELLANQAAPIIESARLYEEAKQKSEERATLIEIGHALFAPEALQDLRSVYETIYQQVQRIMPTDAFMVSRYFPATDTLVMDYLIDKNITYPSGNFKVIPLVARKLFLKEEKYFLFSSKAEYKAFNESFDNQGDTSYDETIGSLLPSESLVFVPLHFDKEVLGMISVENYTPNSYSPQHVNMLLEVALQAGIAVTNAHLYTDLRDAVQRAKESEQIKNHFLLTATHEIRTPLTAIQGYLELLCIHGPKLSEKDRDRFLSSARRASEEVILLLGNVMDTSNVDQKEIDFSMSEVQLSHTLFSVLDILEPNIQRQGRSIDIDVDDALRVYGDDARLRQVLLNIVSNALKYTPQKTNILIRAGQVNATAVQHRFSPDYMLIHDPVVLSIIDYGDGIALEDQVRLFNKFTRLPNAIRSNQRGSGLGLYLCKQIIEAMGGAIWVESTGLKGEGTMFSIALPAV